MKIVKKIQLKFVIFTAVKNRCMLHRHVFEMKMFVVAEDLTCVEKNIKKSHNIWYEARLLQCNHEHLAKPKKVFIYITPKVCTVWL